MIIMRLTRQRLCDPSYPLIIFVEEPYPGDFKIPNKPVDYCIKGTPSEETFETYNYSVPGAKVWTGRSR